ncbi:hypothetical protein TorRG33x02_223280 [Trema orientale]|uniref:Uncharacterized protein n=1 Tax=Trema orientale TaxID=63057 RepID=A0A2P5E8P3_TREOI|nr:hypothetical protein TorRG33x02_223280 [Trema orientale]
MVPSSFMPHIKNEIPIFSKSLTFPKAPMTLPLSSSPPKSGHREQPRPDPSIKPLPRRPAK